MKYFLILFVLVNVLACSNNEGKHSIESEVLEKQVAELWRDVYLFEELSRFSLKGFETLVDSVDNSSRVLNDVVGNLNPFEESYPKFIKSIDSNLTKLLDVVQFEDGYRDDVKSLNFSKDTKYLVTSGSLDSLLKYNELSARFLHKIIDNDCYPYDDFLITFFEKDLGFDYRKSSLTDEFKVLMSAPKSKISQLILLLSLKKNMMKYRYLMLESIKETCALEYKVSLKTKYIQE
jgi:WD40 repeat protein